MRLSTPARAGRVRRAHSARSGSVASVRPMEINGVPAHPLVVHTAVVFVPLAALAAIALVVPRWRAAVRWPALVLAVVAALGAQAAVLTGGDLQQSRGISSPLVQDHSMWGERVLIAAYVMAALVVVAFLVLPVRDRSGGEARSGRAAVLATPLVVLLPVVAVVAVVLVVVTGDLGAQSVWGG